MAACVRAYCGRAAIAPWWQLCVEYSSPLLLVDEDPGHEVADQRFAAGWDALAWAERIAPRSWGNADADDRWVLTVRCRVMASVVTGRASGCVHTVEPAAAVPVVAVARVPEVLRCPACAEPVVAQSAAMGPACDRCGRLKGATAERVAALTGASLIVVGQLCRDCRSQVLELGNGVEPARPRDGVDDG